MKIMELLKDPKGLAFVSGIKTSLIVYDDWFLVNSIDTQWRNILKSEKWYHGKSEEEAVEAFLKHEQNL